MESKYKRTVVACFMGYIIQAIIINFPPLLFLTFQNEFSIELSKITLLVTISFFLQLMTDLVAGLVVDKFGYRIAAISAHALSALGLILLTFLPVVIPDPFIGLIIAISVGAIGGGLLEVIISPTIEACPTKNKEKTMSILHSFYCWGFVATVLISTAFFAVFKVTNWRIVAGIWAIFPIANGVLFSFAPIAPLIKEEQEKSTVKSLFKNKKFWLMMLLMVCAGACEQAVSQWASTFAEKALGISKTLGDLAGPMFFAITMGISRVIFGKIGEKRSINSFMFVSSVLCIVSYLIISLSPWSILSLIGCGLCGFSVGLLWPGTYSKATGLIRNGGTLMFALLALSGDMGCILGPTLVGFVSELKGDNLSMGILSSVVFPSILTLSLAFILYESRKESKKKEKKQENSE